MKKFLSLILLFTAFLAVNCSRQTGNIYQPGNTVISKTGDENNTNWEYDYVSPEKQFYTTVVMATSLTSEQIYDIFPGIDNSTIPWGTAEWYLDELSCLGYVGPLGPYGPLGTLGPIGDNSWDPSEWISGSVNWDDWVDWMYGPLGPSGPLGENGPMSDQYYNGNTYVVNDYNAHMRGIGYWNSVGPIGPLGAVGALGVLGPVGGHGYTADSNGNYIDSDSNIVRTINMQFSSSPVTYRDYDLYENYDEDFAKSMSDNDTSFMVAGRINDKEIDSFTFTSDLDQVVSIVLMPEKQLDDFDFTLTDDSGTVIAESDSYYYIDSIQLKVKAGTTLTANVRHSWTGHVLAKTYRIFVTGSTEYAKGTNIEGHHMGIVGQTTTQNQNQNICLSKNYINKNWSKRKIRRKIRKCYRKLKRIIRRKNRNR